MSNFIEVQDVSKNYADHIALDHISLNVERQSIYGLLGPNGAGKTSLIRILNQITAPDNGIIMLDGEKLQPKHVSRIGYLPEERGLYKKMKVGEQAIYLAQLKGIDKKVAEKRLREWFEKFDIIGWWNKKVEELSKGMQQKIQFIVTIIHQPDLLIFDEPFSGFDPINVNLLKSEILQLRNQGATILFSTHNMSSVEELCDSITLINKGKNILSGSVRQIKEQFKTNTYEMVLKDVHGEINFPENYTLLKHSLENDEHTFTLQAQQQQDANHLIQKMLNEGTIISFKEILPSINDIFIQQVTNQQ